MTSMQSAKIGKRHRMNPLLMSFGMVSLLLSDLLSPKKIEKEVGSLQIEAK